MAFVINKYERGIVVREIGQRTVLSFDFGTCSIGVAVGNELSKSIHPLPAIKAVDGIPNADQLKKVFEEWNPDLVVVGLPLNMDGTYQDVTYRAKKFGNRIGHNFKVKVDFKDERLTTKSAREKLFRDGGYKSLDKGSVDSYSAVEILDGYWMENQI